MKKTVSFFLAALFLLLSLTGCGQKSMYCAENEILTYEKIDNEKTQLVVSRTGNINVVPFCREFEARNPDVQVIYLDITGGNSDYAPLFDWITKGVVPDIAFSTSNFLSDELRAKYFVNLSTNPLISNFQAAALKRTAADDVYSLPGPSNITAMMYNRTLFEQYGWEVPSTFNEFVALCDQITRDTDGAVEPWNPNAKYSVQFTTSIEAFTYDELFGGADNRTWYNNFIAGNEKFENHMEPYFEVLQTLADHGILKQEHFTYSATTRLNEFKAGNIAMLNMEIFDDEGLDYDFGLIPFPTTKGDIGYLCDNFNSFVAIPIKEHTEKETDAIQRFLEFFSSVEGQQVYIGDTMMVSNVKDVPLNQKGNLSQLEPALNEGHMFEIMDFTHANGESVNFSLQQCAEDITAGTTTIDDCIAAIDAKPYIAESVENTQEVVATAPEDMTILETSFYIADMYKEAVDADIGLITHGSAYRGNLMKVFSGDITTGVVSVLKPRSFENESTLVKVSMTGKQLLDALNNPLGDGRTENCIYAYSGLKCQVAPWNELGSKYLSVTLADGTAIENNKLYSVAIWNGTVADEYITEVLETYEGSWEEHMTAKLHKNGTMSAAKDGRIELIWK